MFVPVLIQQQNKITLVLNSVWRDCEAAICYAIFSNLCPNFSLKICGCGTLQQLETASLTPV